MASQPFRPPGWAAKPARPPPALEMHRGEEMSRIPLADKALLFGRRADHDPDRGTFRLDHDSISREHAAIVHAFQGESFVIDLGSRYGTFVDGQKIEPRQYVPIKEGSEIRFGESTRRYVFTRKSAAAAPSVAKASSLGAHAASMSSKAAGKQRMEVPPALPPRAAMGDGENRDDEEEEDPMANYVDPGTDDEDDSSSSEQESTGGGAGGSSAGATAEERAKKKALRKERRAAEKARAKELRREMRVEEKERLKALKKAERSGDDAEKEAHSDKRRHHDKKKHHSDKHRHHDKEKHHSDKHRHHDKKKHHREKHHHHEKKKHHHSGSGERYDTGERRDSSERRDELDEIRRGRSDGGDRGDESAEQGGHDGKRRRLA